MKRNFLLSAFLSTVLLTTSLFSQNIQCQGGHCKVDLSKLFPSKNLPVKIIAFKTTKPLETRLIEKDIEMDFIALDSSKYLMQKGEVLELEENEEIIVLAHAKYIATQGEELEYIEETSIIAEPIENIENKIINKSLPISTHYCANEKKAVYHKDSNSYECA